MSEKSKFEITQEEVKSAMETTNDKIEELGSYDRDLYADLIEIQGLFDKIRNVPSDKKLEYEKIKEVSDNWKQQVDKIEQDYNSALAKNVGSGAAGGALGVGVAAMGPTAAMGIATTFGVASTGTAISALSGAAATNAALAWLGGGALAAGGGGMAAGNAFLAMAGPVGWAIAGVALATSVFFFIKNKSEKTRLEEIFTAIGERNKRKYALAFIELNERINHIRTERGKLHYAMQDINTFGLDYQKMTEMQQYALGSYVNLMNSATQLLINPIMGLQPNYTEADLDKFVSRRMFMNYNTAKTQSVLKNKKAVIGLADLLYNIKLNNDDKELLWKTFRNNKDFLKSLDIDKDEFDIVIFYTVFEVIDFKKRFST